MSVFLRIIILLSSATFALRPARLVRQFTEPCGVACGGGWCCSESEICVSQPSNTVDGGWGCIFQGYSNTDGSPITDEPYNPSQDAAPFTSIDGLISSDLSFISSLTSALSLTSLSFTSITSLPSAAFTPTVIAPTLTTGTGSSVTSTSPSLSLTTTASPKAPSSSSLSSKISTSGTQPSSNSSSSAAATPTPSFVTTSNTNSGYTRNGMTVALMVSLISALMAACLI